MSLLGAAMNRDNARSVTGGSAREEKGSPRRHSGWAARRAGLWRSRADAAGFLVSQTGAAKAAPIHATRICGRAFSIAVTWRGAMSRASRTWVDGIANTRHVNTRSSFAYLREAGAREHTTGTEGSQRLAQHAARRDGQKAEQRAVSTGGAQGWRSHLRGGGMHEARNPSPTSMRSSSGSQ